MVGWYHGGIPTVILAWRTCASGCLERLVSEMTYYLSSGT